MLNAHKHSRIHSSDEQVVSVVFGGQAGSEGKGAIVGFMARRHNYEAAICSFMTNAGHTWVAKGHEPVVVQQLPMAIVNRNIPHILIGAGSAITESQLEKELNTLDNKWKVTDRLGIHPRAMIIEEQDVVWEQENLAYLGSTQKGCGAALGRKASRSQTVKLARDIPWMRPFLKDTTMMVNRLIEDGHSVMVEGSQGFDLDINHGIEYPYCTSRSTIPQQTLADCGIAITDVTDIVSVLRTYPIRVGHIYDSHGNKIGDSGPFGGKELTWEQITELSGSPVPLVERTTVTKRVRRVFEMDYDRLVTMKRICDPNIVALTFADYLDATYFGWTQEEYDAWSNTHGLNLPMYPEKIDNMVEQLEKVLNSSFRQPTQVRFIKTGPNDEHTISTDERFTSLVCD